MGQGSAPCLASCLVGTPACRQGAHACARQAWPLHSHVQVALVL
jgi:hypothetical protein